MYIYVTKIDIALAINNFNQVRKQQLNEFLSSLNAWN